MPEGIAFRLWAPLAAMGHIAVGERRGGFDRPARSAIMGLVAAALGLDRADEDGHLALDHGYCLAQRVRARGALITDYHTVQMPAPDRKARWATRREALQAGKIETLLSSREYRADPVVDVALIRVAAEGPPAEKVAAALRRPAYTLYFGRKSCPLGLPLRPLYVSAVSRIGSLFATLEETFVTVDATSPDPIAAILGDLDRAYGSRGPSRPDEAILFADADLAGDPHRGIPDMLSPDYTLLRTERRRDRVASRRRWQFALRDEIVARPAPLEGSP